MAVVSKDSRMDFWMCCGGGDELNGCGPPAGCEKTWGDECSQFRGQDVNSQSG